MYSSYRTQYKFDQVLPTVAQEEGDVDLVELDADQSIDQLPPTVAQEEDVVELVVAGRVLSFDCQQTF